MERAVSQGRFLLVKIMGKSFFFNGPIIVPKQFNNVGSSTFIGEMRAGFVRIQNKCGGTLMSQSDSFRAKITLEESSFLLNSLWMLHFYQKNMKGLLRDSELKDDGERSRINKNALNKRKGQKKIEQRNKKKESSNETKIIDKFLCMCEEHF